MNKKTWTDCSCLKLKLVRFKGGTTTTTSRNIPGQSDTEAGLQSGLAGYANTGIGNASNLVNQANSAMGNTVNPDWNSLTSNYNNTMAGVNSGYSDLSSGLLPSSYATNRQAALNTDLTGTVGNAISGLGNRGILNSTVTGSALNNISQNASNTLANDYSSDLNTASGLLGQQATAAGNTLSNNAAAQQNSYYEPSQLLSYASSEASPAQNLFNTMYSGRMGTSGATTTSDNGTSNYQALGSLGSAAILCFIGGTKVSTPNGDENIEDIKIGDKVNSIDGIQSVTYVQKPVISNDEYMTVIVDDKQVTTTAMQTFITPYGDMLAKEMKHVPAKRELVYDLSTTGSNTYFANGFAVRGRE